MILDEWWIVAPCPSVPSCPENAARRLTGIVRGHPDIADGVVITTSRVVARRGDRIVTRSGSEYQLGQVSGEYASRYAGAYERLLATLESRPPR